MAVKFRAYSEVRSLCSPARFPAWARGYYSCPWHPMYPTRELARMLRETRLFEPWVAMDGGRDDLTIQRPIAASALLIEANQRQAPFTVSLFETGGLTTRVAPLSRYFIPLIMSRCLRQIHKFQLVGLCHCVQNHTHPFWRIYANFHGFPRLEDMIFGEPRKQFLVREFRA